MNGYYLTLMKIFKRWGVQFVRKGKGDHEIWRLGKRQTTVDRGTNSRITANKVLKQLGIDEKI